MANHPDSETKEKSSEPPAPEVLQAKADDETPVDVTPTDSKDHKANSKLRRNTYRPSHKATFVGLAVVIVILAINTGIIYFVMKAPSTSNSEVTIDGIKINPEVLDTLGVNKSSVGSAGTELVVSPNSSFKGKLTVGGDVSIAGQLNLNSKFTATDASLANLEAGKTSLGQLNVNGDGTVSSLNLRKDLIVAGSSQLQGPVTVNQLLTVSNSVNISGNLSVGGVLSIVAFQTNTLTVGGHIITRGSTPGLSRGAALGVSDTLSISGNDAAGTVGVNIGTSGASGIVANVSFVNSYATTPHVMLTAVGHVTGSVYVNRNADGFSIGINGPMAPGGYAVDYIVMQ